MPSLMKVLKDEIARLSRKEAKAMTASLRRPAVTTRHALADLKRRVAAIERQLKTVGACASRATAVESATDTAEPKRGISGKGIRSLRRRLGLSQAEFSKLVGVTPHGVYLWEQKAGTIRMRAASLQALQSLKGLGAPAAKARLAELAVATKSRRTRRAARRA